MGNVRGIPSPIKATLSSPLRPQGGAVITIEVFPAYRPCPGARAFIDPALTIPTLLIPGGRMRVPPALLEHPRSERLQGRISAPHHGGGPLSPTGKSGRTQQIPALPTLPALHKSAPKRNTKLYFWAECGQLSPLSPPGALTRTGSQNLSASRLCHRGILKLTHCGAILAPSGQVWPGRDHPVRLRTRN